MGLPQDLLDQAELLTVLDKKRPKQANLRRAISTAYYAVFHLLIEDGPNNWKVPGQQSRFARIFDHGRMRQAAERIPKRLAKPDAGDPILKSSPAQLDALLQIAESFNELQRERHRADYDTAAQWTRDECIEILKLAESVFTGWAKIRKSPAAQEFLFAMLSRDR